MTFRMNVQTSQLEHPSPGYFPGRGYGIYGFVTPICFEKLHNFNSVQFHHSNSGHSDSASAVPLGPKICANARLGVGCLRGPESRPKFVGIFQMFSVFFERQHALQRFLPSLGRGIFCQETDWTNLNLISKNVRCEISSVQKCAMWDWHPDLCSVQVAQPNLCRLHHMDSHGNLISQGRNTSAQQRGQQRA